MEPNPNWSTVGQRDYKNGWPPGPVTTAAGATTTNRGPTTSLQFHHLQFSTSITGETHNGGMSGHFWWRTRSKIFGVASAADLFDCVGNRCVVKSAPAVSFAVLQIVELNWTKKF